MPTIQEQLAWEEYMIEAGAERYRASQQDAIQGKRAHETRAGSALLRNYVMQIAERITLYLEGKHPEGRRRNKYAKLLDTLDPHKSALFALKTAIATIYNPCTMPTVICNIGRQIEDELRFSKFNTEYKEYYEALERSWKQGHTKSYSHKRNTLSIVSQEKGMEWDCWTKETHFGVGSLVLGLLMEVCDLLEVRQQKTRGKGTVATLVPSQACIEWIEKHDEFAEMTRPDKMPCIIPPADWITNTDGGYYSPILRKRTPLVKRKRIGDEFDTTEMPDVLRAVNAMQNTPWRVNKRVLEVMREVWAKNLGAGMPRNNPYELPPCPLAANQKASELEDGDPLKAAFEDWKAGAREVYAMERDRVAANLAVSRTVRIASEMQAREQFWFVYQCDFRGRVYCCTSGLSPQGTDHGKGLLEFGEARPLGPTGLYWLKVHGANKFGQDKGTYDERVAWIDERRGDWLRAASDPIGARDVWSAADKPFQFLAWCFEYQGALEQGEAFQSRLPVALDGSCNGLQHFSAMLRDHVGGAAVNLCDREEMADIYQEVADVATEKLTIARSGMGEDYGGAVNWLDCFASKGSYKMPRKLSKKPVMTLPYGSTQQACTQTIFRWSQEEAPDFFENNTGFRHALYLSPILWKSIGEVVIAAREAMDWLQSCASVLAKAGHPIQYRTPLGFPVRQATRKTKTKQIETQIGGRLQLRFASDTKDLDVRKQRQGSSPNFVHSIDATHMMMCLVAGVEQGLTSFAMIHDDFGVHACDTEVWHGIIRHEFYRLHSETALLEDFRRQHEEAFGVELPPVPPRGNLDLEEVLSSPYFFG